MAKALTRFEVAAEAALETAIQSFIAAQSGIIAAQEGGGGGGQMTRAKAEKIFQQRMIAKGRRGKTGYVY